jgi:hypothetical protein
VHCLLEPVENGSSLVAIRYPADRSSKEPVPGRVSLVDEESIEQSHDIYLRFTGTRGTSFSLYLLQAKSLFHVMMNEKFANFCKAKLCSKILAQPSPFVTGKKC